ncbi:MAG: hypothetical protein OXI91_01145 [Chloroflexota bacterium]|nr:hypothetical protein [Chloroflexota bacterium]
MTENIPEDLATIRHTALNPLRQHCHSKGPIKAHRRLAAWDNGYLPSAILR